MIVDSFPHNLYHHWAYFFLHCQIQRRERHLQPRVTYLPEEESSAHHEDQKQAPIFLGAARKHAITEHETESWLPERGKIMLNYTMTFKCIQL